MLRSGITRIGLTATICFLAAADLTGPAGAGPAPSPHIVAKPNNLMIDTKTSLTGTGFPATAKLVIRECATNFWIVPRNPCSTNNSITVVTDRHGRFTRQFKGELCGGKHGPGPTSQICYIGEPHPEGIDTIRLLGAAKVTVTYP